MRRMERMLRPCFSTAWPACRPIAGGSEWAGEDSNLRPTDYECVPGPPVISGCSPLSAIGRRFRHHKRDRYPAVSGCHVAHPCPLPKPLLCMESRGPVLGERHASSVERGGLQRLGRNPRAGPDACIDLPLAARFEARLGRTN